MHTLVSVRLYTLVSTIENIRILLKYFPTRSGTQNYRECYCGNEYRTHGIAPASDCYYDCEGDHTQVMWLPTFHDCKETKLMVESNTWIITRNVEVDGE